MMEKVLKETPSQTAGPYLHIGLIPKAAGIDVPHHTISADTGLRDGEPIIVTGVIRDGEGAIIKDAMVEIWQANAAGVFGNGHEGFARCHTDFETGEFRFETVKPGAVAWVDGTLQAPHITALIFARGINIHLHTRIYFADEVDANLLDPVLAKIDEGRDTLIAEHDASSGNVYRFDICLQGENETVFFDA